MESELPDHYRVVHSHRPGRFATVYAAVRRSDHRKVALKWYPDQVGDPERLRARQEKKILDLVAGPGVPGVLEQVDAATSTTLVLERAPGYPLEVWVREALPDVPSFLEVAIQTTRILARVHEAHILHCDLTPSNILVDPTTLQVHLIDFAEARHLGSAMPLRITGPSEVRGMLGLHFVAPEHTGRMDRGVDGRSDLYALGATMYEAFVRRRPSDEGDYRALPPPACSRPTFYPRMSGNQAQTRPSTHPHLAN